MDFTWPYLVYYSGYITGVGNGPSQVTVRDLRTGAETVIHTPTTSNAAIARPFSTNPGTPYPSATPPVAFTGILGGAVTGDTFFFMGQTSTATLLYEVDHVMTPGSPANVIATLPNHHDGTQVTVALANDRLVLVITAQQSGAYTDSGQDLAFDRVQHRFVDLSDYNQANGYGIFSVTGPELLLAFQPFDNGNSNVSTIDTIYNTATLPTA